MIPVAVAAFDSLAEAHATLAVLEYAGIRAALVGKFSAFRRLAGSSDSLIQLTVRIEDARAANAVLAQWRAGELEDPYMPLAEWVCANCGETVDQEFNVCWNCCTPCGGNFDPMFSDPLASRDPPA
jgi:hypothetical protein